MSRFKARREEKMDNYMQSLMSQKAKAREILITGLIIDGAHHKQWYIERALEALGFNLETIRKTEQENDYDWEEGIAP